MPRPDQVGTSEVVVLDWRETGPIQGGFLRAFEEFRDSSFPWLLDSALHEHGLGRYSFMGSDPYTVIRVKGGVVEEHCRRAVRVGSQLGHHVAEADPLTRFRAWLGASSDLEGAPRCLSLLWEERWGIWGTSSSILHGKIPALLWAMRSTSRTPRCCW